MMKKITLIAGLFKGDVSLYFVEKNSLGHN
jgi:hypothetical protein